MDFNVRIEILRQQTEIDKIGNHTSKWTPFYRCYACVSGEGGKETDEAGNTRDCATASLTIRDCPRLKPLSSTGFCVRFRGGEWNIVSLDHLNFERKYIKLNCEKVRK